MEVAADDVRAGELTQAVRASVTPAGPVAEGDWIGLADGDLIFVAETPLPALIGLLEALVGEDAELVTLICGRQAEAESTNGVRTWLKSRWPNVQIEIVDGGQPLYAYLIAVE
jgi:dihydroxyacetone kinase-like predicted kinase